MCCCALCRVMQIKLSYRKRGRQRDKVRKTVTVLRNHPQKRIVLHFTVPLVLSACQLVCNFLAYLFTVVQDCSYLVSFRDR